MRNRLLSERAGFFSPLTPALSPLRGEGVHHRHVASSAGHILHEPDDEGGPARLMAGAEALAGVAMEVFVKQDQVPPMRILAPTRVLSVARAPPGRIGKEDRRQPPSQFPRDFLEREFAIGAGRAGDAEVIAIIVMVTFERFDE